MCIGYERAVVRRYVVDDVAAVLTSSRGCIIVEVALKMLVDALYDAFTVADHWCAETRLAQLASKCAWLYDVEMHDLVASAKSP